MLEAQDPSDATNTNLQVTRVVWDHVLMLCHCSTGSLRPLVPLTFQRRVYDALHSLSHAAGGSARPTIKSWWLHGSFGLGCGVM